MATVTVDRQPQLLQQFSNIQWNINDPMERKNVRSAGLPKRQNTNPFFFRNNPHPSRVRHIKGLLGHPVCAVMDAGYREGSSIHNEILTSAMRKNEETTRKKETFVPGIGLISIQPTWVEQLQSLTKKINNMKTNPVAKQQEMKPSRPPSRLSSRQSTKGSKTRLLEKRHMEEEFVRKSCSREAEVKFEDAFTRKTNSRDGKENNNAIGQWHGFLPGNIVLDENEANVAHLLAQILKTDSLDVIKHWLMEAPEKEKEVVLEMIRAVSSNNLEFREVMNKLGRNPGGTDIESLRNEYEKMLEMKDIKGDTKSTSGKSSPRASSRGKEDCHLLDVIKENLEADMINSSRVSTRSQKRSTEMLLPQLKREDEEIEVLRSQLASRSSVNVFPAKPPSRRSPR